MKTRKAKWTRGPVQTEPGNFIVSESAGIIAEVPCCSGNEADVDFIAAAFNAATALEDQGYDGLKAIKALPKIVEALKSVVTQYENVRAAEQYPTPDSTSTREARALLARIKEEK